MPRQPRTAWHYAAIAAAALTAAPLIALLVTGARGSEDLWSHFAEYVFATALADTLLLLTGVGVLSAAIGVGAAWLVAAYEFPARRVLEWALLLPLAVPTYVIAYAYLDILHPIGPVQSAIRALLDLESPRDLRLPDIRSMTGCILLLGFVLYPYVYMTTRALFAMQSANLVEAARTMGARRAQLFFRVALPLARPAIAIGVSLALLEALNDIGAAEFLGVRTLTVSIYTTWITRSDLPGATQIALMMLLVVVAIIVLERWIRRRRRYSNDAQHSQPLVRRPLSTARGIAAALVCASPVAIGFVAPVIYLSSQAMKRFQFAGLSPAIPEAALNTVLVAAIATLLTVAVALAVVYAARVGRGRMPRFLLQVASLGYAVPGTVMAIGLLPIVTGIEDAVDAVAGLFGFSTGLILLSTGAAIVYAYIARFTAVASGSIDAGYSRISPSLDAAARTLGESVHGTLVRIHLPLLRPALAAGALLVFVDCMKELPATLLLRPLGFDTLATHLYGEAVRGTYEDAAIAALLIVAIGLVPIVVLVRMGSVAFRALRER
jgi:iron(III) transport system permease protein